MTKKGFENITRFILLSVALWSMMSCQDDFESRFDYTESGKDVTLTIPVSFPEMEVKSRANLLASQENMVNNIMICTFSTLGNKTSDWKEINNLENNVTETPYSVEIETKSGNSYIVAVANVDNYGVQIKTGTRDKLRNLLSAVTSWEDFLGIAVETPSTWDDVRLANNAAPLAMVGAFYNIPVNGHSTPVDLTNWQNSNFTPIFIPSSSDGRVSLGDNGSTGAIHMRRVVSHIKFEIYAGNENITITPQSYRVYNAPVNTWLYERPANVSNLLTSKLPSNLDTANYGDQCTEENRTTYYKTPDEYSEINFNNSTYTDASGNRYTGRSFNFWQGENKHTGSSTTYNEREKEYKNPADNANTGIYTSLCGNSGVWSPNNMASYVKVTCYIEYNERLDVNDNGEVVNASEDTKSVKRTATIDYVVHLGYLSGSTEESKSKDFNCYRNTNYTYRMFIDGVNNVRLEAFANNEPYPGAEGLVSDVTNPTYNLDCHNCAFNVSFDDGELNAYNQTDNTGFGFMIYAYENDERYVIEESDILNMSDDAYEAWLNTEEADYLKWIELRPSTGASVIMPYQPRSTTNDVYYLSDISRGKKGSTSISLSAGYYTVHVKEYAYEPLSGDETPAEGEEPRWRGYINRLPRQFYMRVTRAISNDGESVYARSKYAGTQRSINTYYSNQVFTSNGTAVGVEYENESFGISLRKSYQDWNGSSVNGRYNAWQWIGNHSTGRSWSAFMTTSDGNYSTLSIPASSSQGGFDARDVYVPMLAPFSGTLTTSTNNSTNDGGTQKIVNVASSLDPQGTNTTLAGNINIEAINACMNRNRDDNGNSTIDPQEVKWYVPSSGKYLRMILGDDALDRPVIDFEKIEKLPENTNGKSSRYMLYASDGLVFWAMEGLSMSRWNQWGYDDPAAPWEVRCVRNLGTDLSQIGAADDDGVQMAYVVGSDNTVNMTYYGSTSVRSYKLTENGTVAASATNTEIMPPHVITSEYNSPYKAFQYSNGLYNLDNTTFYYDIVYGRTNGQNTGLGRYESALTNNPCSVVDGTTSGFNASGWRVPNQEELTIMRNLGLFDDINGNNGTYASSNNYIASCTMGYFNSSGEGYDASAANPLNGRYYLGARAGGGTQLTNSNNAPIQNLFIRCVRDVEPNVTP